MIEWSNNGKKNVVLNMDGFYSSLSISEGLSYVLNY